MLHCGMVARPSGARRRKGGVVGFKGRFGGGLG
jgi:hypothetical protein